MKIANDDSIWDLHIHTCKCPKGSSEFSKLSISEYIDGLLERFAKFPKLEMISFTDHNCINADVYDAFINKKTKIRLIIGVEVDTYFTAEDKKKDSNNTNYKHVIFYFDDEKFDLNKHARIINEYLYQNKPVILNEFLEFLICNVKVSFLISPHFMKQRKRGFDIDLNSENVESDITRYIDQLCCFWETSNNSNIQRAIDFLKAYDCDKRVSIISFSDSNDFEKLNNYLENPKQYFRALPTFDGLRMVGTDCRRISFKPCKNSDEENAKYIGKVMIGENEQIVFSKKLNSIIGGRGNGKSLLIDGIAKYLNFNESKDKINNNRLKYLERLNIKVFDLNGNDLKNHTFNFDYYNQGFALKLFENNEDSINISYFKEKFNQLENYDIEAIKNEIKVKVSFDKELKQVPENISGLDKKVVVIKNEINDVKFDQSLKEQKTLEFNKNSNLVTLLVKEKVIPKELENSSKIINKVSELQKNIIEETFFYNNKTLEKNFLYFIQKAYKEEVNKIDKAKDAKDKALKLFKEHFEYSWVEINNRVRCINAILKESTTNFNKSVSVIANGYDSKKFEFVREVKCENLLNYLHRIFCNYFDSHKLTSCKIDKNDFSNLYKLIELYCFSPNQYLQESKTLEKLDDEIFNLNSIYIKKEENIFVNVNERKINLKDVSPGTRANYLLEYIAFNETEKPLLIDQPEDNIDNSTIYNQLTKWFRSLKMKRQVIVVTHDANVVVNSDSENVIICNQIQDNQFTYSYGALEYGDNLDKVSKILDGGKEAIERRLLKYGE